MRFFLLPTLACALFYSTPTLAVTKTDGGAATPPAAQGDSAATPQAKPVVKPAAKPAMKKPAKPDSKKAAPAVKQTGTLKQPVTAAKADKTSDKPAAVAKSAAKNAKSDIAKSAEHVAAGKGVSRNAAGDTAVLHLGLEALDRGRAADAMLFASRMGDPTLADILRGEAYAAGISRNADELFGFLRRHPAWPQRSAIAANAEGLLTVGTYEPMLEAYSADNPPVTSNGFAIWQATLEAHGRGREAQAAQEKRESTVADSSDISARFKDIHMQVRDHLSQKDWAGAYQLAAAHGLAAPENGAGNAGDYATAEFLCGWLSLRYLHDAPRAMGHFENLYRNVKTPVSRSRAAYWLGRTAEALGNPSAARGWYQEAASMPTFFYGQLALAKLEREPTLTLNPEPAIPAAVTARWNEGGLPHAVRALAAIGDEDRTVKFTKALLQGAQTRADFTNAAKLARELHRPYLEVMTAKAANQKNFVIGQSGFPLLGVGAIPSLNGQGAEPALTLGIIRQESEFRPDVRSSAGAIGLMQLMPATAKNLAHENGSNYADNMLLQPGYNIALGRTYLGDRVNEFGGSYILAIAAYNAGKGRVREWLDVYGDPRDPGVDPIDWIELIPIYETRNYVQRVLENTEVYRVRLTGLDGATPQKQSAPLGIIRDLTRR